MNDSLLFGIVDLVREEVPVKDMFKSLGVSRSNFYKYWRLLKDRGVVERIGYGVWSVNQQAHSKLFTSVRAVKGDGDSSSFPVGTDRSHAFMFTMPFPFSFPNTKQKKFCEMLGVEATPIGRGDLWRGFSFCLGDWDVRFHPKTFSATLRKGVSFYSDDGHEAYLLAVDDFLKSVVKVFEKVGGRSWKIGKDYRFKTSRQHHARIRDSLAKGYRLDKKKLHIRDESGSLWLLADYSFSEDELEAVDKTLAPDDYNLVNGFMNSVRDTKVTLHDVLGMFAKNQEQFAQSQEQMGYYAENMVSHVKAVQELGAGVKELTGVVKDIKGGNVSKKVDSIDDLKMSVDSIDDLEKHRDFIEGLSEHDKVELTEWIQETFNENKE